MNSIIDGIQKLLHNTISENISEKEPFVSKVEIECHVLEVNHKKNLSLVLRNCSTSTNNNSYWKTEWLDNTKHTYKTPQYSISEIIKKHK